MMRSCRIFGWVMMLSCLGFVSNALAAAPEPVNCSVPPAFKITRPDPQGVPTPVEVMIFVVDLTGVEESHQTFTADLFMALKWKDSRLSEKSLGYSLAGCTLERDALWHPSVILFNQRDVSKRYEETAEVDAEGYVSYLQRLSGQFNVHLHLQDFPLDEQILPIEFVSRRYSPEEVIFKFNTERSGTVEKFALAGWKVREGPVSTEPLALKHSKERARIDYTLIAKREIGYYVWKVIVPLSLILVMAWLVFWINPQHFGPQVGLSTAAVFTLIAFYFSLNQLLPKVSYLTRLDQLVLGGTIMVFFALIEAVLASRLAQKGQEILARRIDKASRIAYPIIFLILLIVTMFR